MTNRIDPINRELDCNARALVVVRDQLVAATTPNVPIKTLWATTAVIAKT
jgi:hypothetical protein